jgi:hypothetical protein
MNWSCVGDNRQLVMERMSFFGIPFLEDVTFEDFNSKEVCVAPMFNFPGTCLDNYGLPCKRVQKRGVIVYDGGTYPYFKIAYIGAPLNYGGKKKKKNKPEKDKVDPYCGSWGYYHQDRKANYENIHIEAEFHNLMTEPHLEIQVKIEHGICNYNLRPKEWEVTKRTYDFLQHHLEVGPYLDCIREKLRLPI